METNTGKYFKYAIGEIVLVVIGILIALSINNWNERRKNDIIKQSYIENLKFDLKKDIEYLKTLTELNSGYEKHGANLLDYMENNLNEIDTLSITWSLTTNSAIPNFSVTSTTYNDIIASNNINLFNDIEFKRLLDNYYVRNEWIELFQSRILKTAWYDYRDEMIKHHSPLLYQDTYRIINGDKSIDLNDKEKYKIEWNKIKSNKYLKKQVEMILAYRVNIKANLQSDIKNAESILSYIESNK